jgi:4-amino-4-deoxy-L-arabinose transferase-like glycosyltransferase
MTPKLSKSKSAPLSGARRLALPLGIALLGFVLNTIVAWRMGRTVDEAAHLGYGDRILEGSAARPNIYFDSKMPVTALNSIPGKIGGLLRSHGLAPRLATALKDLRTARMVTVAAAFCLCLLVYFFAESLYGRTAGLFAGLLFILSPNLMAHSTVVTTDLYVALATVAFLYCLRRFLLSPDTLNALLVACTLGFAQLTKFSGAYLYLVLGAVLVSAALYSKYTGSRLYHLSWRNIAVLLGLTAICFLAFINLGFVFDRTFTPLSRYKFITPGFQKLQRVPVLRAIPLPLPYAYLDGLDETGYDNAHAVVFVNLMLLGEVRGTELPRSDGFWSYYLVAYALKEPIGMQVLLLLGILWVVRRRAFADFIAAEWPLLVTAVVFLVALSLFSNTQVGIRHILPVLAIFVIVSGAAFAGFFESAPRRRILPLVCLLCAAVSVASYFPWMIPYFNEIVTDRKMAYRYLADSNLDWKQDRDVVAEFLAKHPGVQLDPPKPVVGWVLVRANLLAGIEPRKADYWMRGRPEKPVAHVAYAHLLFHIEHL